LLGFDGVHFTDTGYALFANLFIDAINQSLGTKVPQIDMAAIVAADAGLPAAILAAGLDVTQVHAARRQLTIGQLDRPRSRVG
jgi:hypothetical protein